MVGGEGGGGGREAGILDSPLLAGAFTAFDHSLICCSVQRGSQHPYGSFDDAPEHRSRVGSIVVEVLETICGFENWFDIQYDTCGKSLALFRWSGIGSQ